MKWERCFQFILLDLGHPMSCNIIKNILSSLENTLALGIAFPRRVRETNFGISFLNSNFIIFQSETHLQETYNFVTKNLDTYLEAVNIKGRVSVQEYKNALCISVQKILQRFQEKIKKENFDNTWKSSQIQVALLTRKNASNLAQILSDVINKVHKTFCLEEIIQKYKIVQIISEKEEEICGALNDGISIEWSSCSNNIFDLNYFFKVWLLNPREELQILLCRNLNLRLKCDVEDCIINPVSSTFEKKCDFFSDFRSQTLTYSGVLESVHELEIINRIPVNNLCPSLVFGIPRRIYATRERTATWAESQTNLKIFKELCRELNRTGQGILTKSTINTEKGELIAFHFLTSDGDMLLMNDVTSDELFLPKSAKFSQLDSCDRDDDADGAVSLVKSCIKKIKFLDEYSPENFTSGLGQYLRNYLKQHKRNNISNELKMQSLSKNSSEKDSTVLENSIKATPESIASKCCPPAKKRSKTTTEKDLKDLHPALLAPEVVEKYRKIQPQVFDLPELRKNFSEREEGPQSRKLK